ncbi:MAG: tetratricopeptide repeat protein [Arachidicoccus sp.]|nr:tetratricopeptide repeat protein [Arachidicoccus sp.]
MRVWIMELNNNFQLSCVKLFEEIFSDEPHHALNFFLHVHSFLSDLRCLHCCLYMKESGHVELADFALSKVIKERDLGVSGYYELAIIKERLDALPEAMALIRKVLTADPEHDRALLRRAIIMVKLGMREPASAAIEDIPLSNNFDLNEKTTLAAFNRTSDFWHAQMELFTETPLNFWEVGEAVEKALVEQKPFCLLRLGDGEGAFLMPDHTEDLMSLATVARRYFAYRWFGDNFESALPVLMSLSGKLKEIASNADIVAVPNIDWCRYEWANGNFRTLAGCLSSRQCIINTDGLLAESGVALDLTHGSVLSRLIQKAETVCLVTCHTELAQKLNHALGSNKVESIIIPPAHSDLNLSKLSIDRNHVDVFNDTMNLIKAYSQSRLFLIGAGYLGKFYTHQASMMGAVALDVGSVLDGIMGLQTRPNFEGIDLPAKFWGAFMNDQEAA